MSEHLELLHRIAAAPAGEERDEILLQLSAATSQLIEATGRGLDLNDQNLSGLDLSGTDLRSAPLSRANLHGTKLRHANLSEITMVCPGMERTDLAGASL